MTRVFLAGLAALLSWGGQECSQGSPEVFPGPRLVFLGMIPLEPAASILRIQGLVPTDGGAFLVSDKLDYRVKMLHESGRLLKRIGGRGSGPGRFRGPGPIDRGAGLVAVAEFAGSEVQVFSDALGFISRFRLNGAISDLCVDPGGRIWIGAMPPEGPALLIKADREGNLIASHALRNGTGDRFFDVCVLTATLSGKIVAAFMAKNLIEIWDTSGQWVNTTALDGMPAEARVLPLDSGIEGSHLPDGAIFWSMAASPQGLLYLLGGDYSRHPGRDVYVSDSKGRGSRALTLDEQAALIRVDRTGVLWAVGRDRRSVSRYKITYDNRRVHTDE